MSIDRQRFAAAQKLQELGYVWEGGEWVKPETKVNPNPLTDLQRIVNALDQLAWALMSAGLKSGPRTIQLFSDYDYRRLEAIVKTSGLPMPPAPGQRTAKALAISGIVFDYDIPF